MTTKISQTTQRRINTLATQLLDLFYKNGISYFPPYESWAKKELGQENTWQVISYKYVTELAHFSLHGMTKKMPTSELVKQVLIQAEQWMLQSNGEIAEVTFENGTSSWFPLCLLSKQS